MLYPTIIKLRPRPSQSYGYTVTGLDKRKVLHITGQYEVRKDLHHIITLYAELHGKSLDQCAMAYDEQTEQWIALVTFR